ncbi:indolepyruvate decarboxylase [Sinobaca qinghaiensis]|uniref:Alpha-keto-acid decarboxylase n=1 Tax=Sinobaca qinghaiensis TaxID=342944 RepID=A0A419UU31_9BACL|nr:thiamine pyrophosphate-dependent enzyme [Sinobaca qinghaiensis]RKD68114.1 indolepyruvate decarboxylase [Sinobaca qinghaiensis]
MAEWKTISSYLYDCLLKEGITEIFGVPGDYNFALLDELEKYTAIQFIDNRNELNAGYAADGYAQIKGMSALITTFGVGDLSAANAMAGAYSEQVPLIEIVGSPASSMQENGTKAHHTLMNGDYDVFLRMHREITERAIKITADNAVREIPAAIAAALEHRKPVYIDIPQDVALMKINTDSPGDESGTQKNEAKLAAQGAEEVKKALQQADSAVLLVDIYTIRHHLKEKVLQLAEYLNIPTAQMMQGKSGFNEQHPLYIGMYGGAFGNQEVREYVENADIIITAGLLESDFNTAKFTAELHRKKRIDLQPMELFVQGESAGKMKMEVLIDALLSEKCPVFEDKSYFPSFYDELPEKLEPLRAETYYPIIQSVLRPKDILVVETGTLSYGLAHVRLPENSVYISQGSWQSIGYALPAAFGAQMAAPERRVLLFIGDGSFQLTAQGLSSMAEQNIKPVVFFLNNKGYTVERYLNTDNPQAEYNDIPEWDYIKLVKSFYTKARTTRVTTTEELKQAAAQLDETDSLHFIEIVVNDKMDAPLHLKRLREASLQE